MGDSSSERWFECEDDTPSQPHRNNKGLTVHAVDTVCDGMVRCAVSKGLQMIAHGITPILNVSNIVESFAWFERLGWKKLWDWGTPPTFGAVGSGVCEIFLCQGAQGGRGKGTNRTTFTEEGDEAADKGVWMSVWVEDVDEVQRQCVTAGLDVTFPPTNMPWNVREMHVRHPDGHVFRISRGVEPAEEG